MNSNMSRVHIHDFESADDLKRHLWKSQHLFFPFLIPWRRFIGVLMLKTVDATGFGLAYALSAFIVQSLFPSLGILNGVLNLGAIVGCIFMSHWAIFLLTEGEQKRLHVQYILSKLKELGISKEEFFNKVDKGE